MSIDVQILTALRAAGDGAVSGAELSQKLHVSRAAFSEIPHRLREPGQPRREVSCAINSLSFGKAISPFSICVRPENQISAPVFA